MTISVNSWEKFLEHVKSRVSINTFTTWFQPTRLNRADGEIVKAVFHEIGTPNMKVQYLCNDDEPLPATPVVSSIKQSKLDFESSDHQLNPRYTFDSFVVGKIGR